MTDPKTQTLDLPGATLTYDVREADSESTEQPAPPWIAGDGVTQCDGNCVDGVSTSLQWHASLCMHDSRSL